MRQDSGKLAKKIESVLPQEYRWDLDTDVEGESIRVMIKGGYDVQALRKDIYATFGSQLDVDVVADAELVVVAVLVGHQVGRSDLHNLVPP